jgi:hypothetical protein
VTREQALAELRRLAGGLPVDDSGTWRLLERISQHDAAEELRGALAELGARALLDRGE